MPDNNTAAAASQITHLRELRLVTPGQKMSYLLVSIALSEARELRAHNATLLQEAEAGGFDAFSRWKHLANSRTDAEHRLNELPYGEPEYLAARLTDALVWSPHSTAAAERLTELDQHYKQQWGLAIDPETLTVTTDPNHDAAAERHLTHAEVQFARASIAHQVLTQLGAPSGALAALADWRGSAPEPGTAEQYLTEEPARYARLIDDLGAAGVRPQVRTAVDFVVGYLRSDLTNIELTQSPYLVDPAEEVRGRVPRLLDTFAKHGKNISPIIAKEIEVMTADDQRRVREAGKAIDNERRSHDAGSDAEHFETTVNSELWPGYIDRDAVKEHITSIAANLSATAAAADALAAGHDIDNETTAELVSQLAEDRHAVRSMLNGHGVHPLEKIHLIGVLDELGTGNINSRTLPQLMFVDERSKLDLDREQHNLVADRDLAAAFEQVESKVAAALGSPIKPRSDLNRTLGDVHHDLYWVGHGRLDRDELAHVSDDLGQNMGNLGHVLADAGVDVPTRRGVRATIDAANHKALQHGQTRDHQEQLWHRRIRTSAAHFARETDATRQSAGNPVRGPRIGQRACANRPVSTPSHATNGPAARVSRLHHAELDR